MEQIISLDEFKRQIIEKIRNCGISISELARMTGIKQPTLHKGLFGSRELTFSNALSISGALEMDLLKIEKSRDVNIFPVISNLSQLDKGENAEMWDEYVMLGSSVSKSCYVIDRDLFDFGIFPKRSLFIVDPESSDDSNSVYIENEKLSTHFRGGARLGCFVGIVLRKTK